MMKTKKKPQAPVEPVESAKAEKLSPFEFVKAITQTKENLLKDDPSILSSYSPFVINRALSYFADTTKAANLMNFYHELAPQIQFEFLLNTIRPRKRFSPWIKSSVSEDIKTIAAYYDISTKRAADVVALHTPDQIAQMRRVVDPGAPSSKGSAHDSAS